MATLLFGLAVFLAPVAVLVLLVLSVKAATEAECPPSRAAGAPPGMPPGMPPEAPPTAPCWRLEQRDNGSERLVVRFDNLDRQAGGTVVATVVTGLTALVFALALLPVLARLTWPWLLAGTALLAALAAAVVIGHRTRIVDSVIDLTQGLVFHRHRRLFFQPPEPHRLTEFGLVLSHLIGEGTGVAVFLSGADGEFEVARFGPPRPGAQPWLQDHPDAADLRQVLAERLGLRRLGVI